VEGGSEHPTGLPANARLVGLPESGIQKIHFGEAPPGEIDTGELAGQEPVGQVPADTGGRGDQHGLEHGAVGHGHPVDRIGVRVAQPRRGRFQGLLGGGNGGLQGAGGETGGESSEDVRHNTKLHEQGEQVKHFAKIVLDEKKAPPERGPEGRGSEQNGQQDDQRNDNPEDLNPHDAVVVTDHFADQLRKLIGIPLGDDRVAGSPRRGVGGGVGGEDFDVRHNTKLHEQGEQVKHFGKILLRPKKGPSGEGPSGEGP
jgi:hypothetical protein